jgi:hypothetical protein
MTDLGGGDMAEGDTRAVKAIYVRYQAYLLRLWQERPQTPWRASLQDAVTGKRRGFADLQSLFDFLAACAKEATQQSRNEDEPIEIAAEEPVEPSPSSPGKRSPTKD